MADRKSIPVSRHKVRPSGSGDGALATLLVRAESSSARLSPLPGWSGGPIRQATRSTLWSSAADRAGEHLKDWPVWLASVLIHALVFFVFWLVAVKGPVAEISIEALFSEFANPGEFVALDSAGLVLDQLEAAEDDAERNLTAAGSPFSMNDDQSDPAEMDSDLNAEPELLDGLDREPSRESPVAAPKATEKPRRSSRAPNRRSTGGGKAEGAGLDLKGLLEGRGAEARAKLAKAGGGNKASEDAVELGLKWLARHQKSDGSWSFQHGPDDPGTMECPTAATGLALMAFLGAGYTHKQGEYAPQVERGLRYLIEQMDESGTPGWLRGSGMATMYTQGIGTIALCEAYTMTKDRSLRRPAQQAVTFIVNAQDPQGGGWRYRIPQAGDTSVLGWQLMALKSAVNAELEVPSKVVNGATHFLESVESDDGALAGYTRRSSPRQSTTAVALLCRMYLGRPQSHRGLRKGMTNLTKWGPMPNEMYYTYYATQAMHHWGGGQWTQWNSVLRDQLVKRQAKAGGAAGSWVTDHSHGAQAGGRLYTTCMSIMTLEVYYRYLPIYKRKALNVADELSSAAELEAEVKENRPGD